MPDQDDEHLVDRFGPRGEILEGFRDVLASGARLHATAALVGVLAEIGDVRVGHAVLLRGVHDPERVLVERFHVILVAAHAGDHEEMRVLRKGRCGGSKQGEEDGNLKAA
jgi:hypothetical protein